MKYVVNLDMEGLQLLNFLVQGLSSDPTPFGEGHTYYNTTSHQLRYYNGTTWVIAAGTGTVTAISIATAHGFAGSSDGNSATPTLTIRLNGTPSAILKGDGSGGVTTASAGTDYIGPTSGSAIQKANGSGGLTGATASSDYAPATTGSAILKANGSGGFSAASAGTDYVAATTGSGIQKGDGSGGLTAATANTDYLPVNNAVLTGAPTAPTPSTSTGIANKGYVDATAQGLTVKNSVVAATTGAETFTIVSGSVTVITGTAVDSASPAIGDRILVKDAPAASGAGLAGSTQPGNGIYRVTNATTNLTVTRVDDMTGTVNLPAGVFVFVEGGTVNGSSGWVVSVPAVNTGFTYGTNNVKWTQFSGAGEITPGTALGKTGNTLNVTTVPIANGGTGQTGQQAAIDALAGAVTAGQFLRGNGTHAVMAALAAADVPTNAGVTPAAPGTGVKYALVFDSVAAGLTCPASFSWAITHNLNNSHPIVKVYDISGGAGAYVEVIADVTATSANAVSISFTNAATSGQFAAVIVG